MNSLDNRLKTAAGLCRRGKIAADVGCDHAQLACYLALNVSRLVIASDVRDGPLEAARRTISECGVTNIKTVKSDGLKEIDYADDVIICGMGGELIAQIISGCRFLSADTRFILQPMTKADYLRRWLYENGFEIDEEIVAAEKQRRYVIIKASFTGVSRSVDDYFALTGKITDKEYLASLAEKLLVIAERETNTARSDSLKETARRITAQITNPKTES